MQERLKDELIHMEKLNVIKKIDEPTDWVSSLVIVEKKNGALRICLDPRDINIAFKREHFKLVRRSCPTLLVLSGSVSLTHFQASGK